jgi:hypothetical protein
MPAIAALGILALVVSGLSQTSQAESAEFAASFPGLRLFDAPGSHVDGSDVKDTEQIGDLAVAQQGMTESGTIAPTDEDAARALERLLVTRGALVLPLFGREIEPELRYRYSGTSAERTRRDTFTAALTGRVGLPFDSQVEVRVPYVLHDETDVDTASGLGDVSVMLTKEVLRERDSRPNLLLSARWTAPTGDEDFSTQGLATGSGFQVIEGLVTSSLRRDPLVFFATASYAATLPAKKIGFDIDPGDVIAFKAGAALAASPDTSISVGLNMAFSSRVAVDGRRVRGTDRVIGLAELEVAHIVTRRLLLDVRAEIGVTTDAPDLALIVSLPFRF